jgi:hypothetical protein
MIKGHATMERMIGGLGHRGNLSGLLYKEAQARFSLPPRRNVPSMSPAVRDHAPPRARAHTCLSLPFVARTQLDTFKSPTHRRQGRSDTIRDVGHGDALTSNHFTLFHMSFLHRLSLA